MTISLKNLSYIGVFVALLLLLPALAFAKSRPDLHIKIVPQKEVARKCKDADDYRPTLTGCYWFTKHTERIYLADTLSGLDFAWVFFHEYGHYLMWHKDMTLWAGNKEKNADEFADWMLKIGTTTPEKAAFFTKSL